MKAALPLSGWAAFIFFRLQILLTMSNPKDKRTKGQILKLLDKAMEQEDRLADKIKALETDLADCRKKAEDPRSELTEEALSASKVSFRIDYYRTAEKSPQKGIIEHLPSRQNKAFEGDGMEIIGHFIGRFLHEESGKKRKKKPLTGINTEQNAAPETPFIPVFIPVDSEPDLIVVAEEISTPPEVNAENAGEANSAVPNSEPAGAEPPSVDTASSPKTGPQAPELVPDNSSLLSEEPPVASQPDSDDDRPRLLHRLKAALAVENNSLHPVMEKARAKGVSFTPPQKTSLVNQLRQKNALEMSLTKTPAFAGVQPGMPANAANKNQEEQPRLLERLRKKYRNNF